MIKVMVQVEAGSRDKNFYNEKTLEYRETRRVSQPYPYPYGFVIGTHAADGDCVDCYVITTDRLTPGLIVECEPIGLLEQDEGGEIDHKLLAAMPDQGVELGQELMQNVRNFIEAIFAKYPEVNVRVGPIRSAEAALQYLQSSSEN